MGQDRSVMLDSRPASLDSAQPADLAERACTFGSVLCAIDGGADAQAARRHAELLAKPGGTVELVLVSQLTRHGSRALQDGCEGHDLLVLSAGAASNAAVQHAPIPVLIARWCPLGTDVTDTILVAVDDSPESTRAVELAGRLAAAHGGRITILVAPAREPRLQRAIAASGRVLLRATGEVPRVFGEQLPPERTIPSAASAVAASLVVLGSGSGDLARSRTATIVSTVGCSVLAVPRSWPDPSNGHAGLR
jgi:nucleotide-binding universal stress UspA family protein